MGSEDIMKYLVVSFLLKAVFRNELLLATYLLLFVATVFGQ